MKAAGILSQNLLHFHTCIDIRCLYGNIGSPFVQLVSITRALHFVLTKTNEAFYTWLQSNEGEGGGDVRGVAEMSDPYC